MTGWLVDPTNNIEIEFASFKQIQPISSSALSRYSDAAGNMPRVFHDAGQPFEFSVIAELTTAADFDTIKRKMNYFEKNGILCLLVLPSENMALEGYVENLSYPLSAERVNMITMSFKFTGGGFTLGYMKAAADLTTTGTLVTDTAGNNDQAVRLDAISEYASLALTQSAWALPGLIPNSTSYCAYRLYARAKDSAQVASDCDIRFYNNTHAAERVSSKKTLTASFAWYSVDYTLVSGDAGDAMIFQARKDTATANNIYVDMLVLVQHMS